MKKLLPVVALVAFLAAIVMAGCSKEEPKPEAPKAPDTNAPATK